MQFFQFSDLDPPNKFSNPIDAIEDSKDEDRIRKNYRDREKDQQKKDVEHDHIGDIFNTLYLKGLDARINNPLSLPNILQKGINVVTKPIHDALFATKK